MEVTLEPVARPRSPHPQLPGEVGSSASHRRKEMRLKLQTTRGTMRTATGTSIICQANNQRTCYVICNQSRTCRNHAFFHLRSWPWPPIRAHPYDGAKTRSAWQHPSLSYLLAILNDTLGTSSYRNSLFRSFICPMKTPVLVLFASLTANAALFAVFAVKSSSVAAASAKAAAQPRRLRRGRTWAD